MSKEEKKIKTKIKITEFEDIEGEDIEYITGCQEAFPKEVSNQNIRIKGRGIGHKTGDQKRFQKDPKSKY